MPKLTDRLSHAWNAFMNKDPTRMNYGTPSYSRPDRIHLSRGNERSIINSIFCRIAIDCSSKKIRHVKVDENDHFIEEISSPLNECLSVEANIDQTGRAFFQDVVMTMFDEGCVGIMPIDTDKKPKDGSFDIYSMRTASIEQWYPRHVKIDVYNDITGKHEQVMVNKRDISIVENPLYSIVNEPNSILQRLIRKLNLLDAIDEQSSSGKLDLIIQLPYVIKTEQRKQQAESRRKDIEEQLAGSKFGIAYTDGTERITQLNRPIENNLMTQIEFLTNMLYSQLGITQAVLDGTADEKTMLNYNSRTIEPILSSIVDEMKRKFLTKTARTQKQSIAVFNEPFKLVPVSQIAEIADKFTRNEIMTSNEVRQIIGMKPSNDPKADELRNKNLNQSPEAMMEEEQLGEEADLDAQLAQLDSVDSELDSLESEFE